MLPLVWIDLEATGLVPSEHAVLEVAAIMTDDRLREIGRFHRVVHWPRAAMLEHLGPDSPDAAFAIAATSTGISREVVDLHARNGLWKEAAQSLYCLAAVDEHLAEFIVQTAPSMDGASAPKALLAGSSIWFDRALMAVHLPRSLKHLHYRLIDVTTLSELSRRVWPRLHGGRPSKREVHRAMPDIEDSLALCRYYAEQIEASR